jgi:hypothetical protein
MTCTSVNGTRAVDFQPLISGDRAALNGFAERARTTVEQATKLGAPVNAIAVPLAPPRGGLVDFGLIDAGMMIIYDPSVTRTWAIEVVAVVTHLDLVDVTPDDLAVIL